MKKGLIVFLVFALVLVLALLSIGVFANKAEANTATLTVDTTNTTIIVRNEDQQVISNSNGKLVIGETYSVEVVANQFFELKVLIINEVSQILNLTDNQCTFMCNGNVKITAVSIIKPDIENPPSAGVTEIHSISYICAQSISSIPTTANDIIVQVKDSDKMVLAELHPGQSYDYLADGEKYYLDAYTVNDDYQTVYFSSSSKKYLNITNFPQSFVANNDFNIKIKYSTSFNIPMHNISCVGISGQQVTEFIEGETYTLSDNAPEGFKTNLYVNNQLVQLPYTFTYTEDMIFDFELVEAPVAETATLSVTSNVEGYSIYYVAVDENNNYSSNILADETTEFEVGKEYIFFFEPPAGYYLVSHTGWFESSSEDFIPSTHGNGGLVETNNIELNLTFQPAVNPIITGENFTVTFTNFLGEETNILVFGQTYTATFTPDEGYTITDAIFNGAAITTPYTFAVIESMEFTVTTQAATVTPTVTVNGYNADFSNIGAIKYRTDYSSPNYIYDNLTLGESYYIQIDIYANASTNYYISAIYVNGTLLGSGNSTTSSLEVGRFEATNPLNIVVEIGSK